MVPSIVASNGTLIVGRVVPTTESPEEVIHPCISAAVPSPAKGINALADTIVADGKVSPILNPLAALEP